MKDGDLAIRFEEDYLLKEGQVELLCEAGSLYKCWERDGEYFIFVSTSGHMGKTYGRNIQVDQSSCPGFQLFKAQLTWVNIT